MSRRVTPEDLVAGLPALVPMKDAAAHCHVSPRTLRNWIRDGRLETIRTAPDGSGRVLVPRVALAQLLASMLERAPDYG